MTSQGGILSLSPEARVGAGAQPVYGQGLALSRHAGAAALSEGHSAQEKVYPKGDNRAQMAAPENGLLKVAKRMNPEAILSANQGNTGGRL